jgi:hypothetical protein
MYSAYVHRFIFEKDRQAAGFISRAGTEAYRLSHAQSDTPNKTCKPYNFYSIPLPDMSSIYTQHSVLPAQPAGLASNKVKNWPVTATLAHVWNNCNTETNKQVTLPASLQAAYRPGLARQAR